MKGRNFIHTWTTLFESFFSLWWWWWWDVMWCDGACGGDASFTSLLSFSIANFLVFLTGTIQNYLCEVAQFYFSPLMTNEFECVKKMRKDIKLFISLKNPDLSFFFSPARTDDANSFKPRDYFFFISEAWMVTSEFSSPETTRIIKMNTYIL